jgi:4,5-DOPA dioxygenase extradiol
VVARDATLSVARRRRSLLLGVSATTGLAALSGMADLANAQSPRRRMPVIFVGHGSPMNAISDNPFTRALQAWGAALPRPTAILSVSAHWLTPGQTLVTVDERPKTIHDFGGFPRELHEMQYPAPGAPLLAREAASRVRQNPAQGSDQWGLDHGTWTVLHHLFPKADIPVFQLSIDYAKPAPFHHAVGRELGALRDKGVLIMGSGNVVHNLRATDRQAQAGPSASRPWAQAFDDAFKSALAGRDDKALMNYASLPGAEMAVATPDHYYPVLYPLGAAAPNEVAKTVFDGFHAGTLSMRCLQFG